MINASNKRLVMSKDLNGANKLFGGTILSWIDEDAYIEVITLLKSNNVVTKYMSSIEFIAGAKVGDVVEIKTKFVKAGSSSITVKVSIINLSTGKPIAVVDEIVMVNVDEHGVPKPHGLVI